MPLCAIGLGVDDFCVAALLQSGENTVGISDRDIKESAQLMGGGFVGTADWMLVISFWMVMAERPQLRAMVPTFGCGVVEITIFCGLPSGPTRLPTSSLI